MFSKPQAPLAPPRVPTDTVIPLFPYDDSPVTRSLVNVFMMRFDDVLDPERLQSSLEKLLSRDDWRKVGSRMRKNVSSQT